MEDMEETLAAEGDEETEPTLFQTTLKFYQPIFFPHQYVCATLIDEQDKVLHRVTQFPSNVSLSLNLSTGLRLVLYIIDGAEFSLGGEFYSQVYIPMEKVIENGMSLSFCTLWLRRIEQGEKDFPKVTETKKMSAYFTDALQKGQELLHPKIGVSVKKFDDENDEDRLSIAMAQLYGKVETITKEKLSIIESLKTSVGQRNSQIQDLMKQHREHLDVNEIQKFAAESEKAEELKKMQEIVDEKMQHIETLRTDIHTLKLARRGTQSELGKLKKSDKSSLCSQTREKQAVLVKRVQIVAEKERQKTRILEKEVQALKQQLEDGNNKPSSTSSPVVFAPRPNLLFQVSHKSRTSG